jgi:ribose 5-phosphate isomerase B
MTVYLAADHAGFKLKGEIFAALNKQYEVIDCGAYVLDPVDDYPDFMSKAAQLISAHPQNRAIIIGGSGQGEAMVANRYKGVRCAVFYGPHLPKESIDIEGRQSADEFEIVRLERTHNDANVLSLGARFITTEEALSAVQIFLETQFFLEERHVRRIMKF